MDRLQDAERLRTPDDVRPKLSAEDAATLLSDAGRVQKNAHAPYSNYHVGAAALAADGQVYLGANVETAVYNLGLCAERVAVFDAIKSGVREIIAIAIVADGPIPPVPCGACLQVISEFGPHATVITRDDEGEQKSDPVHALLNSPFDRRHLS